VHIDYAQSRFFYLINNQQKMKYKVFITAISIAILLVSCTHTHTHATGAHDHDHAHDETLQLTAYSADFEVFAEATPFVVGQPSDILAHFSYLENFKPLEEGSVTASLVIGLSNIR